MATREQVQEALGAGARIAAPETQLQIEQTRATTAEQERSALIQTLLTTLSKGSRKGKGKRYEGQNHMSNAKCWNCGKSGHYGRDCKEMWWSEEQPTGKGRSNSAESSNWKKDGREEDHSGTASKMRSGPIHWNSVSASTRKKPKKRKYEGGKDHERKQYQ